MILVAKIFVIEEKLKSRANLLLVVSALVEMDRFKKIVRLGLTVNVNKGAMVVGVAGVGAGMSGLKTGVVGIVGVVSKEVTSGNGLAVIVGATKGT